MAKKQKALPGMELPTIEEIDLAASAYVDARDGRMSLLKEEVYRHNKLLELMQKHQLPFYEFDGLRVEVVQSDMKVRVRKKKEEGGEEQEE